MVESFFVTFNVFSSRPGSSLHCMYGFSFPETLANNLVFQTILMIFFVCFFIIFRLKNLPKYSPEYLPKLRSNGKNCSFFGFCKKFRLYNFGFP